MVAVVDGSGIMAALRPEDDSGGTRYRPLAGRQLASTRPSLNLKTACQEKREPWLTDCRRYLSER